MVKQPWQAYDGELLYTTLGVEGLRKNASPEVVGLSRDDQNLDGALLIQLLEHSSVPAGILEVGCGYGRLGKEFLSNPALTYWGIDVHQPYVDVFRATVSEDKKDRILGGNFLDYSFPFEKIGSVIFPWSVICDFSEDNGQIAALERARDLLLERGRIFIDIPVDVINRPHGIKPADPNIDERYDLAALGLRRTKSHPYQTYSGRNRRIIEIEQIA